MSPARDESNGEAGKIISADELDIEESDNVVALDDGRFVIGSSGRPSVPDDPKQVTTDSTDDTTPAVDSASPAPSRSTPAIESESAAESDSTNGRQNEPDPPDASRIDSHDVRRWLENDLDDVSSRYGFHIAAKSERSIDHQQMFSDDVGTVFDSLLMWYAQQVDTGTPVEDVLGILLMESNVRVRYSPRCLHGVLEAYDLTPDDSIADLFRAIQGSDGVVFPPDTE